MSLKMDSSTHVRCPRTGPAYWGLLGGVRYESVGEGGVREEDAGSVPRSEGAQGKEPVAGADVRNVGPQPQAGQAPDAGQGASPRAAVPIPGPDLSREADPGSGSGLGGRAVPLVGAVKGGLTLVDAVDQRALGAEPPGARAASGYESSDDGQEAWALQKEAEPQDLRPNQAGQMVEADYPHPDRVLERARARLDGGGYGEPLRPIGGGGLRPLAQPGRIVLRMGRNGSDPGQAGGGGGGCCR